MGGWVQYQVDIKEGTCDEHWVLYMSDGSLNSITATNMAVSVKWNLNKNLKNFLVYLVVSESEYFFIYVLSGTA